MSDKIDFIQRIQLQIKDWDRDIAQWTKKIQNRKVIDRAKEQRDAVFQKLNCWGKYNHARWDEFRQETNNMAKNVQDSFDTIWEKINKGR